MAYFIIFFFLAAIALSVLMLYVFYRILKARLLNALNAALQKKNKELVSKYAFLQWADIILKAPPSTRKELLQDIFEKNAEKAWTYLKEKKPFLNIFQNKEKPIRLPQNSDKSTLFLAAWESYVNGDIHRFLKIFPRLPEKKLSPFEKKLRLLFEAYQALSKTDLKNSAQKAQKCATWFHKHQCDEEEAEADILLFESYKTAGYLDVAQFFLAHAEQIYQKNQNKKGAAKIAAYKGVLYMTRQQQAQAETCFQEALKKARLEKMPLLEARVYLLRAVLHEHNDKNLSLKFAKKACELAQKAGCRPLYAEASRFAKKHAKISLKKRGKKS